MLVRLEELAVLVEAFVVGMRDFVMLFSSLGDSYVAGQVMIAEDILHIWRGYCINGEAY